MLQLNLKGLCATHVTLYNIVQFVNIGFSYHEPTILLQHLLI